MMTGARLASETVTQYLADLDRALAVLPPAAAAELREQIRAHIEEALPANPDDSEVAEVLTALGSPEDIVRAADDGYRARRPSTLQRLRRVRWWVWLLIAAALAALGSLFPLLSYLNAPRTAPALIAEGSEGWLYPQDSRHAVYTQAAGASQWTVPIRSGQEQGFVVGIVNPSKWTVTVLGWTSGYPAPGGFDVTVAVGDSRNIEEGGSPSPSTKYILPAVIPPGGARALRVTWKSTTCLGPGTAQGISDLYLQVKVGWVTRTEAIQLPSEFALSGPSTGPCS